MVGETCWKQQLCADIHTYMYIADICIHVYPELCILHGVLPGPAASTTCPPSTAPTPYPRSSHAMLHPVHLKAWPCASFTMTPCGHSSADWPSLQMDNCWSPRPGWWRPARGRLTPPSSLPVELSKSEDDWFFHWALLKNYSWPTVTLTWHVCEYKVCKLHQNVFCQVRVTIGDLGLCCCVFCDVFRTHD